MLLCHPTGVVQPPDTRMETVNHEAKRSLTPEDDPQGSEVGQGHI